MHGQQNIKKEVPYV